MSDLIRLVDLEVWSCLGVTDTERGKTQRLLVSVEMRTDVARAAVGDELALTVDYDAVSRYVQSFAGEKPRHLLETFAEDLAHALLESFALRKLKITAKKFVLPNAAWVAVEIERKARKKAPAPRRPK